MSRTEPNRRQLVDQANKSSWLLPVFWIVLGSSFYFGATYIRTAIVQDKHDPGPAAICMLCSITLIVLGFAQAVQLILAGVYKRAQTQTYQSDNKSDFNIPEVASGSRRQAILAVAAIAFYIFSVFEIGFGLATLIFGIASMKSLGTTWFNATLATTTCVATVYLLFIKLLGILLPSGRWDLPF